MRSKGTASGIETVGAETADHGATKNIGSCCAALGLHAATSTCRCQTTRTGHPLLRQHCLFGIQRDFDLCSSLEAKATMIDKLWKMFDIESDGLHEHTTKQLSDIMRFLEIHWEHICATKD